MEYDDKYYCSRIKRFRKSNVLADFQESGWGELQLFDRGLKVGLIHEVDAPRVHDKYARKEMAMERGGSATVVFVWGRAGLLVISR